MRGNIFGGDMDVIEAIKTRRSVRRFTGDSIPDEVMNDIIEAVQWAPSWANTQCWEVIVVKDQDLKGRIAGEIMKGNPASKGVMACPVVLVMLAVEGLAGFYNGEAISDKGDWYMYDIGIAMQNVTLAAWRHGLGTVHVGAMDAPGLEKLLDVPEGRRVVSLTPLGYPEKVGPAPPRKDISEFVFTDRYGNK